VVSTMTTLDLAMSFPVARRVPARSSLPECSTSRMLREVPCPLDGSFRELLYLICHLPCVFRIPLTHVSRGGVPSLTMRRADAILLSGPVCRAARLHSPGGEDPVCSRA